MPRPRDRSLPSLSRVLLALGLLLLASCVPAGRDPGVPGAADAVTGAAASAQAEQLLRMGASALERGEAATAARLLELAVQLHPAVSRAAVLLGRAYLAQNRPRDAADVFRAVLDREPDHPQASRGFARAMLALDRPEVAIAHLEPLATRTGDIDLANLFGVALVMAGRGERAITVLREARARAPDDLRLTENLALVLALEGRYEEAIALLRPVAEGPRTSRRTRQNLALVFGLKGDFEAAERIGRIDLDDEAVATNTAFFRLLREGAPGTRSAVLLAEYQPRAEDVVELSATNRPRRADAAATATGGGPTEFARAVREEAPEAPGFRRKAEPDAPRSLIEPQAALRETRSATDLPPAPQPARPPRLRDEAVREAPPPPAATVGAAGADRDVTGERGEPAVEPALSAVALESSDLAEGAVPLGQWVLRLGIYPGAEAAAAAWRRLQQQYPVELSGLVRLSAAEPGPQPLLVGPLASGEEAERLCALLRERGSSCHPLKL